MRIIEFVGRIAPLFHAFEWAPRLNFKMTRQSNGRVFQRGNKLPPEGSEGKRQKKVYCRRLTRAMENYAKD